MFYERLVFRLMLKDEHVYPVPDVLEATVLSHAPARKQIVEHFGSVLQVLHCPLSHFTESGAMKVDVMLQLL